MKQLTTQGPFATLRRLNRLAGPVLAMALAAANAFGQSNACDLDGSGVVNSADVNRAVSMALGTTPCTVSLEAANTCTISTVQRVINSALGQPCVTYNAATHNVGLTWQPSPSAGVAGYNIYRRTTPTGTPTRLNATVITGTTFTDTTVQLGLTYYYSATSVGSSGLEGKESAQAQATIPLT